MSEVAWNMHVSDVKKFLLENLRTATKPRLKSYFLSLKPQPDGANVFISSTMTPSRLFVYFLFTLFIFIFKCDKLIGVRSVD